MTRKIDLKKSVCLKFDCRDRIITIFLFINPKETISSQSKVNTESLMTLGKNVII